MLYRICRRLPYYPQWYHHLQKRQHYQFVAKQPLEHKVHHHISILGVDLRQHFLFRLLFICHKLNNLKLRWQSSTEIAVYRKSIRLSAKIGLPHTWKADCYLEFYFCFTKTEIKFMSLQAKSRGFQGTNNYAQVFLSGSPMHLSYMRCRCVLMHIKVRGH